MKPPVAKVRLSTEVRAQVLELRRSNSITEVARITGLVAGTVKAICSRAGCANLTTTLHTWRLSPATRKANCRHWSAACTLLLLTGSTATPLHTLKL